MAKCRGDVNIPYMGMGIQAKNNKAWVSVTDPIEACIRVRTNTYSGLTGGTAMWSQFDRPDDQMNCPEPLCNTSGTLFLSQTAPAQPVTVTYELQDATEDYINGVESLYLIMNEAGVVNVEVSITDKSGTESVKFKDHFNPQTQALPATFLLQHAVDEALTMMPSTDDGMVITISIQGVEPHDTEAGKVAPTVGISSFSMVQDKADFEQNETISFTCMDELDFPSEVDLTDPTCLGQAPDPDSISTEMTITAQQVSGNFMKLNPLLHLSDETEAFDIGSVNKSIANFTVNGKGVFGVKLPNFSDIECSFMSAYLPACDANAGRLSYNTVANDYEPDLTNFKVITDTDGTRYAIFAHDYKDQSVTVTYPVVKSAKIYDATAEFTVGRRIRFVAPFEYKNGYKGYIISDNAFVTSFPFGWSSTEDTPLEFTITFMNVDGRYFRTVLLDQDV